MLKKLAEYFAVDLRRHVDNVSIDRLNSASLSFQNLNSSHPVAENESEWLDPISEAVDVGDFAYEEDPKETGSLIDHFPQNNNLRPIGIPDNPTPTVSSRGRSLRNPTRLQDYCVSWF